MKRVYDPIGDAMGHIPFTQDYVHLLSALIIRYYYSLHSAHRKVIVTDCDNTLWNGVCGEAGASGVNWDGDAGKLQQFLAKQISQGMLICLCSKNTEADVGEVFDTNTAMPLRREQITVWRVNWEPKSQNIKSLSEELNLNPESFIFIDDNQIECAEVKANCPGVLVLHWPLQGGEPVKQLSQLWVFDHFKVSSEDKERTQMYQAETTRRQAARKSGDWQQFIAELELTVDVEPLSDDMIERVSQLTLRTNQFNFTTIRRSAGDIKLLQQSENFACSIVKAKDRFGAYGIVGVIMLRKTKTVLIVDTFLLSCRVLGRGVEHEMIRWIAKEAEKFGIKKISFLFKETPKNLPARRFLDWLVQTYSGQLDNEGKALFSAKKLLECRYTDYAAAGFEEPKQLDSFTQKNPAQNTEDPGKMTDFWLRHSTVDVLAKEIKVFHKIQFNRNTVNQEIKEGAAKKQTRGGGFGEPEINRDCAIQSIREVFCKYSSVRETELNKDVLLESLALDSKSIVSITSELNILFNDIPATLLFECLTFGAVCDFILGKDINDFSPQHRIIIKEYAAGKVFYDNAATDTSRVHVFSVYGAIAPLAGFFGSIAAGFLPKFIADLTNTSLDKAMPYLIPLWIVPLLFLVFLLLFLFLTNKNKNSAVPDAGGVETGKSKEKAPIMLFSAMFILTVLRISSFYALFVFFNIYLDSALKISTDKIGLLTALSRAIPVPAALLTPLLVGKTGKFNLIIVISFISALFVLPIGLSTNLFAAAISFVVISGANAIASAAFTPLHQEATPEKWRSLMAGSVFSAEAISFALMAFFGGYLIKSLGYQPFFLVSGATTLASGFLFWILLRNKVTRS